MAIAASLVVRISTEFGSFVRGLNQVEKDLTRFAKQSQRLGKSLSTDLTLPIVGLGAVLFKAASDVERSENMFDASFGAMAASARAWSTQTAEALGGLAGDEVRQTMARFNELATSMDFPAASALTMSKGLTQLTLDLMAYRNISEEAASGALEAAMAGRMKGMRELGVVIKDADVKATAFRLGIARTGQTLTTGQTALASYILMTERLAKVNGEFARSQEKPAVMLIRLKQSAGEAAETLGAALMPGMQKVVGLALWLTRQVKDLADSFARLPVGVRLGVVGLAGLAAAIGPVLWGLGTLILLLPKLKLAIVAATTGAGGMFTLITLAIVAMSAAVIAAAEHWDALKQRVVLAWAWIVDKVLGGVAAVLRAFGAIATMRGHAGLAAMMLSAAAGVESANARMLASTSDTVTRLQALMDKAEEDRTGGRVAGVGAGPRRLAEQKALVERQMREWEAVLARTTASGTTAARAGPDALAELAEAQAKQQDRLTELLRGQQQAIATFGMSADAVAEYEFALAGADEYQVQLYRDLVQQRQALEANAASQRRWAEAADAAARLVEERFAAMKAVVTDTLTTLFSDVLMGQTDAFQRFLDTIYRMLADFAAKQLVQQFMGWAVEGLAMLTLPKAPSLGTGLMGNPLPAPTVSYAGSPAPPVMRFTPAPAPAGDVFHVHMNFAPTLIDARSGAAWLRANQGVITETVIEGVAKSRAARRALVGS